MRERTSCPACGGRDLQPSVHLTDVPVHVGALWPTPEAARSCPRGDLRLVLCRTCGYAFNSRFDRSLVDYELPYDNALHHSKTHTAYETALARHLVERYDLRNKDVIEIGCGSGHFLGRLCRLGGNRGVGFDPSHQPEHLDPEAHGRVVVHREHFGEQHVHMTADLVCCRHVLEHIENPAQFLTLLRRMLDGRDTVVHVEVPNVLWTLRHRSVWDLMYEHCGYYTTESIAQVFASTGYEVLDVAEAYGGQFVSIEARLAAQVQGPSTDLEAVHQLSNNVQAFQSHVDEHLAYWKHRLSDLAAAGANVAIWGAGGRTVGFANLLDGVEHVDVIVDINPRKRGTFLSGTGHPIISHEQLINHQLDAVIVMNPMYIDEVRSHVHSLGSAASVELVLLG